MHVFAHFEKRSEESRVISTVLLKIQNIFVLKAFGLLDTFHSEFLSWWVTGLGAGFVSEPGGYIELSYCRQRAHAGNAGWVMPMQSPDYFLSSQG